MSTASREIYQPLVLSRSWSQPFQLACKRALDILLSGFLLVLVAPIILILGLAVKLTSRGPVFYRWNVVGRNGRPFLGYKIRSMVMNADEMSRNLRESQPNDRAGV